MFRGAREVALVLAVVLASGCVGEGSNRDVQDVVVPSAVVAIPTPQETSAPTNTVTKQTTTLTSPSPPAFQPAPTLAPRPTPTSTPAPRATPPRYEVVVGAFITDVYGSLKLIGELKNVGGTAARFVNVRATFYDTQDAILDSTETFVYIDVLEPGTTGTFVLDAPEVGFARYNLTATSREAPAEKSTRAGLEIVQTQLIPDSIGGVRLVGLARNVGRSELKGPHLSGLLLDDGGKPLGAAFDVDFGGQVPPGALWAFATTVPSAALSATDLKLYAYADGVASVPAPQLKFGQVVNVTDRSLGHSIVGEVVNEGTRPARFIEVTIFSYDGAGALIGSGYAYAHHSSLPPGGKAIFEVSTGLKAPPASYVIAVLTQPGDPLPAGTSEILQTSKVAAVNRDGDTKAVGEVTNVGTLRAGSWGVAGAFYSADGVLLAAFWTTDYSDLPPGQTVGFSDYLPIGDISKVDLGKTYAYAYADRYTAVS